MAGKPIPQMLKFDALRARFEQLVMNYNVLSCLHTALVSPNCSLPK